MVRHWWRHLRARPQAVNERRQASDESTGSLSPCRTSRKNQDLHAASPDLRLLVLQNAQIVHVDFKFPITRLIGQLVPYLCGGAYDRWLDAMLGKLFFIIYSRD